MSGPPGIVLDTNIFVAAGFDRESHSSRILRGLEEGRFAPLFRPDGEHRGPTDPERFDHVEDPDDRKFASLAARAGAVLVTNDDHLLAHRGRRDPRTETPAEFHSSAA